MSPLANDSKLALRMEELEEGAIFLSVGKKERDWTSFA
jgi:hypothetical protein